jgi:hypothetical protein
MVDAVTLSTFLHSKMLLSPELNRSSPCYIARRMIQLYIKLKYIATFAASDIDEYASMGDPERDEVRMVLHHLHEGKGNLMERLAVLAGISPSFPRWGDILSFVQRALPFAEQTESLLVRGSDDRSILDPHTHCNKYNTSTIPCAIVHDEWISRASCTASSISMEQYARCESIRQDMLLAALSINHQTRPHVSSHINDRFDTHMHGLRHRIACALGLSSLYTDHVFETILTPSGTDAELLATSCALAQLHQQPLPGGVVTSIITAGGEIGRGSATASAGQHFSSLTPSGDVVVPGSSLRGFPSAKVVVREIKARESNGTSTMMGTVDRDDRSGPSLKILSTWVCVTMHLKHEWHRVSIHDVMISCVFVSRQCFSRTRRLSYRDTQVTKHHDMAILSWTLRDVMLDHLRC